ncbi:MAG TPA: MATE family efflux transporter [Thermoanaerobaculia bacterium]|jgi:MATE family multidrug resistance protein|nr:MATE family efflux transporter [Thermoanaerobaculia bacterium]
MPFSALRRELRELFRLALPLSAAGAGTQLMALVDIAVIGRLGARELGGSGLATAIFFSITVLGMGISLGVDPMIAQAVGAGDRVRARHVMWQGIWLSLIVAAVLTIPLLFAPTLLELFGIAPDLVAPARSFLHVRTFSLAPFLIFLILRAYLQAHGVTRPMLLAVIICNVINLAGDVVFVFGGGGLPAWCGPLRRIPALGVAGAALATVIATVIEVAIVAFAIWRLPLPPHDAGPLHRWTPHEILGALRIGLPVGLQMGAEIGIFALVGLLAGRIGTLPLAAHQLVLSLASFTYTISVGVATAGSVRVARAIGARDAAATRLAGHAALVGGIGVMTVAALAFAFFPRPLARLVSDQEDVIATAIPLFLVAAVFQLSDGVQAVGSGALRGAADTRFAFLANVTGYWIIGLPVALLLGVSLHMGVVGLWWGLCAGLTVVAVLLFLRFERLSRSEIAPIRGAGTIH